MDAVTTLSSQSEDPALVRSTPGLRVNLEADILPVDSVLLAVLQLALLCRVVVHGCTIADVSCCADPTKEAAGKSALKAWAGKEAGAPRPGFQNHSNVLSL